MFACSAYNVSGVVGAGGVGIQRALAIGGVGIACGV